MKKSNFLKVLFASLIMILIIGIFSCEEDLLNCEVYHTGTLNIYNDFPGVIIVDVFTENSFRGERTLGIGQSTIYSNIPAGNVEIWETDAYSDWGYWDTYVEECEITDFSIYYEIKGIQQILKIPLNIEQKIKSDKK